MKQVKTYVTKSVVADCFEQERRQFFKHLTTHWQVEASQTSSLTERKGNWWRQRTSFRLKELPEWRFKWICTYHQTPSFRLFGEHRLLWDDQKLNHSFVCYEWGVEAFDFEPLTTQLKRIQDYPLESFGESFSPLTPLPLSKVQQIYQDLNHEQQFQKRLSRHLQRQGFKALQQFAHHHPHVQSVGIQRANPTQRFKWFQVKVLVDPSVSDDAIQSLAFSIETLLETLTYQANQLQFELVGIYDRPSALRDCQTVFN